MQARPQDQTGFAAIGLGHRTVAIAPALAIRSPRIGGQTWLTLDPPLRNIAACDGKCPEEAP